MWFGNLDPGERHEQLKQRPLLVVSIDELNEAPPRMVTVVPITGNTRTVAGRVPLAPPEAGITKPSMIITDQVRTISQTQLRGRWGRVSAATMHAVEDALRIFLGL